jgi:hypothetical protein
MLIFFTFFIFFQCNSLLAMDLEPNYNDLFKKFIKLNERSLIKEKKMIEKVNDNILKELFNKKYNKYNNIKKIFNIEKKWSNIRLEYILKYNKSLDSIDIKNKKQFNDLIVYYSNSISIIPRVYREKDLCSKWIWGTLKEESIGYKEKTKKFINEDIYNFLLLHNNNFFDSIDFDSIDKEIEKEYNNISDNHIEEDIKSAFRTPISMIKEDQDEEDQDEKATNKKFSLQPLFRADFYNLQTLVFIYYKLINMGINNNTIEDKFNELLDKVINNNSEQSIEDNINDIIQLEKSIEKEINSNIFLKKILLYLISSLLILSTASGLIYYYFDSIKLFFK